MIKQPGAAGNTVCSTSAVVFARVHRRRDGVGEPVLERYDPETGVREKPVPLRLSADAEKVSFAVIRVTANRILKRVLMSGHVAAGSNLGCLADTVSRLLQQEIVRRSASAPPPVGWTRKNIGG